jgi:muconolactone delta-isomerase
MLYQVTFDIDRQALGSGENAMKVRAAETERAVMAQREGKLIGLWLRADCGGVIFILDVESHEALVEELRSLPVFPYVKIDRGGPARRVSAIPRVCEGTEAKQRLRRPDDFTSFLS